MAGTVKVVSSPEWIAGMRERLAVISSRHEKSIQSSAIEERLKLQSELAVISIGLFGELPKAPRSTKTKKNTGGMVSGVEVERATQRHTRSFSLETSPEPELQDIGSFARVVEITFETFGKRPVVPLVLGDLALQERLRTSTHVGLEFNGHLPSDSHPMGPNLDDGYATVDVDISSGWYLSYGNLTALVEGLHSVAVNSQFEPGELELPEAKVLA